MVQAITPSEIAQILVVAQYVTNQVIMHKHVLMLGDVVSAMAETMMLEIVP